MKAILEFNLPEDEDDFKLASHGADFYFTIIDFDDYLREELKYHGEKYTSKQYKLLENLREKLTEIAGDRTNIADFDNFVH
jgi:hypothetical protein